MNQKHNIIFICTNNAGRSQITEAVFRREYGELYNVFSAGVDPWDDIHPVGRKLMQKNGFSMEGHKPEHVNDIDFSIMDMVVTIGDPAEEGTRDLRRGITHIHWDLGDPARADGTSDSEAVFIETKRRIEEQIKILVKRINCPHNLDKYSWQASICCNALLEDYSEDGLIPEKHIPMLAEKGFKLIELSCYRKQYAYLWDDSNMLDKLIKACADNEVTIWSIHPPENEELLGTDNTSRKENLDMLRHFAELSSRLGATCMPIHLWSTTRSLQETEENNVLGDILKELDEICLQYNVTLCLETLRSNVSKVSNAELMNIIKTRSVNLGMVIDSGHSHISGDLHEITAQAGSLAKNLHLHENDGINDLHQVPGSGGIDWARFAENLKQGGYKGPITYEIGHIDKYEIDSALDDTIEHYKKYFAGHILRINSSPAQRL
ncbi:MAG: TIM barrel protein [Planctomycetota bacterium]|jgi:sugar phosphate isomerase/epimerase/protein-tyrosine-phosphatase